MLYENLPGENQRNALHDRRGRSGKLSTSKSDGAIAYRNEEYILDAEHFTGVEFAAQEKEIEAKNRSKKYDQYERWLGLLFSDGKSETIHKL